MTPASRADLSTSDLLPAELAMIDVDASNGATGYGYTLGEYADPTPEQHARLIARSRQIGRFLSDVEVRSVLCAEGGDDANH